MRLKSQRKRRTLSAKLKLGIAVLATISLAAILIWSAIGDQSKPPSTNETGQSIANNLPENRPLTFTENLGQWHSRAKFMAQQGGMIAWFEKDAITLQLEKQDADENKKGVVTRLTFAGASEAVHLEGENRQPGARNYFIGNDRQRWQSNVAGYEQILYQGLYAGVDLRVRPQAGRLEYDLLLQPGADLKQVVVQCAGAESLEIEADGSLVMQTELGPILQKPPLTWQELPNGERLPIVCDYHLLDATSFGFFIPDLDPTLAVVIDPGLEWSTFVGGSGQEEPGSNGLVVADNGDILYCGRTNSVDFPITAGAYSASSTGDDVFISRWNPDLVGAEQLIWSTLVGGAGFDHGDAIQVDESGNITVAGQTGAIDFPTTSNAYDTTYNGGDLDGFIVQLNASGSNLLYGTFFGGSEDDLFRDFAIDSAGNIILTGNTFSPDFPVTSTAFDTSFNDSTDVFVTRLNPNNNGADQLIWSTFFGGSDDEFAWSLAVDAAGTVTVSGDVESRDLSTTSGAYNETHNGGYTDAFIAQFSPDQSGAAALLNATYVGGNDVEVKNLMALQPNGMATLVGTTYSRDFHLTADAYSAVFPEQRTVYVSRFDFSRVAKDQLTYSTFVAGNLFEEPFAMTVDDSGEVVVVGWTNSSGFPVTPNAADRTYNGRPDGFAFRLNPNKVGRAQLEYSTFLGTEWFDFADAVALDSAGNMIVGGRTFLPTFPITPGAFQQVYGGGNNDAFLTKIVAGPVIPVAKEFLASMDGHQHVPPVSTRGHGRAVFELNADSTALHYEIIVKRLVGNITAAHFHIAGADTNGPVVKTISDGSPTNERSFAGVWRNTDAEPLTPALVAALCERRLYVSVHTDSLPAGEIRGQVLHNSLESLTRSAPGDFYAPLSRNAGDDAGSLIRVDPQTGAGTLVGPMGINFFGFSPRVGALAVSSKGEIFVVHNNGFPNLWRVDAVTGAGTLVASTDLVNPDAMAFDMNDRLYAIENGRFAFEVIDPKTGAAIRIGNLFTGIAGMAFDPTDNTLWASSQAFSEPTDAIFTIDVTTGDMTLVGQTGFGSAIPGIQFDAEGNLFGVIGGGKRPNDLIAIDKETGAGAVIGPVGFAAVASLGTRIPVPAGPQISIDARAINVGNAEVGQSATRTISITNYGSADLTVSAIADPGAPFSFTELPALPAVIPPRKSETFRVTFTPTSAGRADGALAITSNDSDDAVLERELFGQSGPVVSVETASALPEEFALAQNYPNPFNPSTTIRYDLPKAVHVELVVYDILGRTVRTLVNIEQTPGSKQTVWDGRNDTGVQVATGLYVYRIKAGDFVKARKLMLIK